MSRPLLRLQTVLLLILLGVALILLILTFLFPDAMVDISKEDQLIENLQVLSFLLAGMGQLFVSSCLVKDNGRRKRGIYHFLLFVVFFFVAMEEISWGQRLFGWHTPAILWKLNFQREINIHNLGHGEASPFNLVVTLFIITFCYVLPIANQASRRAKGWLGRLHLPIIDIDLVSIFFIAGLLHSLDFPSMLGPNTWMAGLLTVLIFLLPLTLYLSRTPSGFHEGLERPLLQESSIALIGTATLAIWLYEPTYQVWIQNVAFESQELLFGLCFLFYSVSCIHNLGRRTLFHRGFLGGCDPRKP